MDSECTDQNLACLVCGTRPTIRSHLIPQAFAREVRDGDQNFALMMPTLRVSQNGLFDDTLLCKSCDNRLGQNEKYAFEAFQKLRSVAVSKFHIYGASLEGDRFIRFAAGICWKYCVTKREYGRIEAGPYTEILKEVALGKQVPLSVNMFMVRLKAVRFEECFFRAPLPGRYDGVNFIRLTLGAFLMFLKIDSRPEPRFDTDFWLRGRTEIKFQVWPMEDFEEGKRVRDDWRRDKRLGNFLLKQWTRSGLIAP